MPDLRLPPMGHYARATLTVVLVLVGISAAWAVRSVLLLVVVAAVLAVGLDPAVRRLERLHLSRGWAVVAIFLATIGFLVLFGALVVPPLVREVGQLASDIPGYIERLQRESGWVADLQAKFDLSARLGEATSKLPSIASASFGTVLGFTKGIASLIFNTLTVSILTVYFLMALPRIQASAPRLFRGPNRERDVHIFQQSLLRIGGYVSGNIAISVVAGVVTFVALSIIGVPFAAALAMWVAIADLIPTVGATLGALAAVIVAAFSGVADLVATAAFFVAYQQVENYVIAPRVMAKAVDLSPAAVIVSVLIGGSLAGFAGALLALPLAAAGKVVLQEVWLNERLAAGPSAPGSPGGPPVRG